MRYFLPFGTTFGFDVKDRLHSRALRVANLHVEIIKLVHRLKHPLRNTVAYYGHLQSFS